MPQAWRMIKERHAASAFTGEGAAQYGGRWNSRGVAVVDASQTQALAALESASRIGGICTDVEC
ncbi:MAG TPA: RES domain-containing protein [Verrucomicrobiae bacterium]|nr:RES domain-containing protein [Verrucomicrobiae bacterium]